MKTLYPYQQKILDQIRGVNKVALFIEMRLGKTVITLKWLESMKPKRTLILCPKSVMPVWSKEIVEEGYGKDRITILTGKTEKRLSSAEKKTFGTHFFITNYETAIYCNEVLKLPWDVIILDESTKIRNPGSKTTKSIVNLTQHVNKKVILSGLPAPESPMDYFEQMRFLFGNFMGFNNFWKWRNVNFFQIGYAWEFKRGMKEKILEEVSKIAIVLSRKSAGIGERKVYETRYTFMNIEQKKAYNEMMKDFETVLQKELITTKYTVAKYEYLAQIASGVSSEGKIFSNHKFMELINLLEEELKGESVVIWFKHTIELQTAEKFLHENKIPCAVFYGEEKSKEAEFKAGKIKVMLAQPKGNQYGIDWSIASTVIYFSNWWDGEVRAQSEDRIVNVKKKEPLLYIDLVCKGTIEEDVVEILKDKKLNSQGFLDKLDSIIRKRMEKWTSKQLIQSLRS